MTEPLKQAVKNKARQLGFTLAGVTTPDRPPHFSTFEKWLAQGRHGTLAYLAAERARLRRADPKLILPECKSILVLAVPYSSPKLVEGEQMSKLNREDAKNAKKKLNLRAPGGPGASKNQAEMQGRIASYAWREDYHHVLPERMKQLVAFTEQQVGAPVPNCWYTDTGPILERDLAQRAGLGWIGKNTCLIHPRHGSYFLLAEILLGLELESDPPFSTDHCGACTRCLEACPTQCILPDRTLDARRCISYLTIELKEDIPPDLRPLMDDWVFGCDVCQMVCPWNRFADERGDPAFSPDDLEPLPVLTRELSLTNEAFNRRFQKSPIKRPKRGGFLRNVAVALGNHGDESALPTLEQALQDREPIVREHAAWAINEIKQRNKANE